MNEPLSRVIVALDTADWDTFNRWCRLFGPRVGMLKVGLEAFTRWGPVAVERANEAAAGVFLDLKLHDIPQTVAGAVVAARGLGVRLLTVHIGGGRAVLEAAVAAAAGMVDIVGVSVLTHLGPSGARGSSTCPVALPRACCAGGGSRPRRAARESSARRRRWRSCAPSCRRRCS